MVSSIAGPTINSPPLISSSKTLDSIFLENDIQNALMRRPRRNRQSAAIRGLVQENHLHASQFVAPLFIIEGKSRQETIASMPGVFRYSLDYLLREVFYLHSLGIRAVDLFCYISAEKKDADGSEALKGNSLLQQAVCLLKQEIPEMCVMVDIALDPYTSHGHDGVLNDQGIVDNDKTLILLAQMSLLAADAGADIVAPSDMMDGRIAFIRRALDQSGFTTTSILSYAAKYASSFYGPFREALNSTPKFGDKKGYQMNPANVNEALIECHLDELEGADMLLIKPALPYLDVISKVRAATSLPLGAYHVSGEYSMIMAAAQNGWLDAKKTFQECLLSIKRAGADFILTYAARQVAENLAKESN